MSEYLEYRFKRHLETQEQEDYQNTIYNTYPIIMYNDDQQFHNFIKTDYKIIFERNEKLFEEKQEQKKITYLSN